MPVILRGRRVLLLQSGPGDGPKPPKRPPCEFCGKAAHRFAASWGNSIGNSGALRENILAGTRTEDHPWYTGPWSLSAHHLICSEAIEEEEDWGLYCRAFGYDVNRKENGVMLPSVMSVACELHVPVHRGNHAAGWAYDVGLAYPKAVAAKLQEVEDLLVRGGFCADPEGLTKQLDELSKTILAKVARFAWTLSRDGRDYRQGGVGCSGVTSMQEKPPRTCPAKRQHHHKHPVSGRRLVGHSLQVGT